MKRQSIAKGEVASLLSSSREGEGGGRSHRHRRATKTRCGEEMWGRGDSDESCGGRGCVFVIFLVVERCGQRPWGEGGRGTTMTTMAGGVVVSSLALARLRSQLSSILLSQTEKEKKRDALEGPNNQHIIGKK
mgnify:CR=1 FL=1